jgi:hypothetical protein
MPEDKLIHMDGPQGPRIALLKWVVGTGAGLPLGGGILTH